MLPRCCFTLIAPTLAILIGSAPAPADDAKALDLKPKWKKGETARYEMTGTEVRESAGKVVRKVATNTPVEVEIVDTDEEGYVVRWVQGTTVFEDPKDDEPGARAFNAMLKGLDIDLAISPAGAYTGLRNWKELRGTGYKVLDAVLARMAKTGTAKTTLEYLRKELEKHLATQETIEAAFSKQAVLLVLPYGRKYELGKAVEYDTVLPNVLGGDEPFPAKGSYVLKSVDKEANTATLVFKQAPVVKEMNLVLRKWLDDTAAKTGKPAPKDVPELDLADVIEYEFDLASGWVKTVTHTRTAKQPMLTQTNTVALTRKGQ